MTSKPVAQLLVDLGVAGSHSRPHVSNDNPYSEENFKTLKYFREFPEHFGSIQDARTFCEAFFTYYNHEQRHGALGLHTRASVHFGTASEIRASRAAVLDAASRPPTPTASPSGQSYPVCPAQPGSKNPRRRRSYRSSDDELSQRV